jgi:uncharacterized protein YndB with AHSA1/START domain
VTLIDQTAPSQAATLTFDFDLPHRPEKVWRALTEPELLAQWLLPVLGLELAPGTAFTFQAPPKGDWDGVVRCKLLDVEPQRALSWRWVVGDVDTVVTFTLAATPAGTRLHLVHTGFRTDQKSSFGGSRWAWKSMGSKLEELLGRSP